MLGEAVGKRPTTQIRAAAGEVVQNGGADLIRPVAPL
jgi:hypothetical protein